MKLISILTMAALAIPCYALAEGKAEVFSGKDVKSQLAALVTTAKASGSGGATLGDYKSHAIKLSVRTASGGAEVHAHYDDIFIVTEGTATLVTGGTVLNAKADSDGETKGKRHSEWTVADHCPRRHRSHSGRHAAPIDDRRWECIRRNRG